MGVERFFADTNLFLRYLTNDVPEQADAVEALLRRAAGGEIHLVTNALVIAEIAWTLESYYRLPRSKVSNCLLAILNTPGLEVAESEVLFQAALWYGERGVDFADAYNAAWVQRQGIGSVYTFDEKHFSRFEGIGVRIPGKGASREIEP